MEVAGVASDGREVAHDGVPCHGADRVRRAVLEIVAHAHAAELIAHLLE